MSGKPVETDCEDCEVMSVSPGVLTEQYSESGFLQWNILKIFKALVYFLTISKNDLNEIPPSDYIYF